MEKLVKDGRQAGLADVEAPEVFMSVVVPAYNEEDRLSIMLEEAVDYLEMEYGTKSSGASSKQKENGGGAKKRQTKANGIHSSDSSATKGWEIIIVSDGSTDDTISTALAFARTRLLPPGSIRVVKLEENRGKGGAVIHGMRHVRGKYVIFADADGASKFEDLGKLVTKAHALEERDPSGRAVVIGSRAHLVGSEAVVKVGRSQSVVV
jgi:dolichyl-phosphate beta-glucosyltransferase